MITNRPSHCRLPLRLCPSSVVSGTAVTAYLSVIDTTTTVAVAASASASAMTMTMAAFPITALDFVFGSLGLPAFVVFPTTALVGIGVGVGACGDFVDQAFHLVHPALPLLLQDARVLRMRCTNSPPVEEADLAVALREGLCSLLAQHPPPLHRYQTHVLALVFLLASVFTPVLESVL